MWRLFLIKLDNEENIFKEITDLNPEETTPKG
jgi:hypothetical protein